MKPSRQVRIEAAIGRQRRQLEREIREDAFISRSKLPGNFHCFHCVNLGCDILSDWQKTPNERERRFELGTILPWCEERQFPIEFHPQLRDHFIIGPMTPDQAFEFKLRFL